MKNTIEYNILVDKIFNFCIRTNTKFLLISGIGGSGKTTLSKSIKKYFEDNGFSANLLDTDDFVIKSDIRRKAKKDYIDSVGNEYVSSYTTSFAESYLLNSMISTVRNLGEGFDFYHIPKNAKDESEHILMKGDADIHIIEGVGLQFIEKPANSLLLYVDCDLDLEVDRRICRSRDGEENKTRDEIKEKCLARRKQLNSESIIKQSKFDLILNSMQDFNFKKQKDVFNVLGGNMNKDCDFAIKLIKQASNMLTKNFDVIEKGDNDVVTSIDLNIEKYVINKVKTEYPDFTVISEEFSPENKLADNCVIINGIDGTVNVSKRMPIFGIQMAIIRGGINTASVVYLPFLNELYYCDENISYLNGKPTSVESVPVEKGLISATGTKRIECMVKLQKYGLLFRDYGSIAVSFAWVASGKLSGAIYNGDKVWNYYPALQICEKAGAKIVNKKGVHIAACNDEFLNILKSTEGKQIIKRRL